MVRFTTQPWNLWLVKKNDDIPEIVYFFILITEISIVIFRSLNKHNSLYL
jgi:hypothetical protein